MVIDSNSNDDTLELCRRHNHVATFVREFDNHTSQWNYGIGQCNTPWVLSLDADYVLGDGFEREIEKLAQGDEIDAFSCSIRYCIYGRPLRGTLYPPRLALFRRDRCRYIEDGHTQVLEVEGNTGELTTSILHDDWKAMPRWCRNQIDYARLEAEKLLDKAAHGHLGLNDRLRSAGWIAPLLVLPYCLILRRGLLDGWHGWFYALQRLIAEVILALFVVEGKLRNATAIK